jgi:alpha-L-rhamnosidase
MWERWNSYSHEHGFGDVKMNSFNHYAYGSIGQWMYERIAGLAADSSNPGYKHFFIRPLIVAQVAWARAELQTPYGFAVSSWVKQGGKVLLNIAVPPNASATIQHERLGEPRVLTSGVHCFEWEHEDRSGVPSNVGA